MLCDRCIAKVTGGCFLSKKRMTRCDRTELEIRTARDVLLMSHKLDEIATRYNTYHNEEDRSLWYKMIEENS